MFTKSIRWRLQLWLAFLLACVLTGFGVSAYQLHRTNRFGQIDEELESHLAAMSAAVRTPPFFGRHGGRPPFEDGPGFPPPRRPPPDSAPPGDRPEMRFGPREITIPAPTLSLFDETDTSGFYFSVWSRDGTLLKSSGNAPAAVPLPERLGRNTGTRIRLRDEFREAFQFTEMGECVLTGRSIAADMRALDRFAQWLVAAGGAVLALGLGGGWLLASRALRPVAAISATANRISAGSLSERISGTETENELGQLAAVLNSTFARLEAAFAQQKQFTADASHELRTPLAVLISETQTALARERSAAEYRETVEACLDTAQQMRRLTESLLELARLDAEREPVRRNPLDLAEHTRACVERLRPLVVERGLTIHCEFAPAKTIGSEDRLAQVITNLLTNAINYNRPDGEIRIRTATENGSAIVTVADTGRGIASEDLPHIFERFYRADKSRSRAEGRCGLGLAICKAIVDAEGGKLEVSSQIDVGSTFTVRLPGQT